MIRFLVGLGIGVVGTYFYLKRKNNDSSAKKELDCIRLSDILDYFRSDEVKKKLLENKNLRLVAKKAIVSNGDKQKIQVALQYLNTEKKDYERSLGMFILISDKIDEPLAEKFGTSSTWVVEEAVL